MSSGPSTHPQRPQAVDVALPPEYATDAGWRSADSALRHLRSHLFLWISAAILLTGDLISKRVAFDQLKRGEPKTLIPGLLDLELSLNAGALFGMGPGLVWLFVLASIAALGFVVYLFATSQRGQRVVHFALALLLAGALGNLVDRTTHQYDIATIKSDGGRTGIWIGRVMDDTDDQVVRVRSWGSSATHEIRRENIVDGFRKSGVVRDFLRFTPEISGRPVYPWIFNVADAYLVIGVGLLLLSFFFEHRRIGRQAASARQSEG